MSHIRFESLSGTAHVSGREFASMGMMVSGMASGPLVDNMLHEPWMRNIFGSGHYVTTAKDVSSAAGSAFFVSSEPLYYCGKQAWPFNVSLNTAIDTGGDVMRLCARIVAQCEAHCYVEPENRTWLAGLIADGLETGVFRSGHGWDEAIALLEGSTESLVALSHSVSAAFVSPETCGIAGGEAEEWYEMDQAAQWDACVAAIRERSDDLELSPFTLDFRFGDTDNIYQILNALWEERNATL